MSPDAILEQDFGLIAELVRGYAQERPQQPALIHDVALLNYGELDQLMDRVAASLQRDGVRPRRVDRDLRRVVRRIWRRSFSAPCAPASRSRRSRLHRRAEALATMLADSGAKMLFLDRCRCAAALRRAAGSSALDRSAAAPDLDARLARAGRCAARGRCRSIPARRSTSSTRRAPPARPRGSCSRIACAGLMCAAAGDSRLRRDSGHDLLDAAVLEHDAGEFLSGARRAAAPSC